jgi:V/A-type H+-transporting ATPase subunit I
MLVILKPFVHLFIEKKHGHKGEGLFITILESIIETIETFVYYLSNTASFMRMGALTLSHASLSYAIFTIAGIMGDSLAGNFFGIVIIVVGNIFIIVLEGLVAAIQTMRLQYYEFFSKFFSGDGKGFKPFKIEKVKKRV